MYKKLLSPLKSVTKYSFISGVWISSQEHKTKKDLNIHRNVLMLRCSLDMLYIFLYRELNSAVVPF